MKRVLNALILLYPKSWRNRYRNEFGALLDDVRPSWRTLFDVLGGALKMQMRIWSPWKVVPAFAMMGVLFAAAFTLTIPKRYVSTAIVKMGDKWQDQWFLAVGRVESRAYLTTLIKEEGLYRAERARMPIQDVVEQMRQRDIGIKIVDGQGAHTFAVSFSSTSDAEEAHRTAERLASRFVGPTTSMVVTPPNLPAAPAGPRLSRNIVMGLFSGVVLGSLFALFSGLKVWKLAAALGVAGAIAGGAIAFVLPVRFASEAVVRFEDPDQTAVRERVSQIVETMRGDGTFRAIAERHNLYSKESDRERKLRDHLHITYQYTEPVGNGPAMVFRFDDSDRYTARMVMSDVVSQLINRVMASSPGVKRAVLIDTPSLPLRAYFPNRPVVAGSGLSIGLACAILLGVRRRYAVSALRHA
jgi:hypothetical protein